LLGTHAHSYAFATFSLKRKCRFMPSPSVFLDEVLNYQQLNAPFHPLTEALAKDERREIHNIFARIANI
jgi:hypothetical protein